MKRVGRGCGQWGFLIGAAVSAALAWPSVAGAQLGYLSSNREVEVSAYYSIEASYVSYYESDEDRDQTADVGDWNRSLLVRSFPFEEAPAGLGRAEITSSIDSSRIRFRSLLETDGGNHHAYGGDPGDDGSYEFANGFAGSALRVRFSVGEPTPYSLRLEGAGTPHASDVRLESTYLFTPGTEQVHLGLSLPPATTPFRQDGTLTPGRIYTLSLDHDVPHGLGEIDLLFVVPEPSTALLLGLGLLGVATSRRAHG